MPEYATVERITAHWAQTLGCDPRMVREPGIVVRQNAAQLADYRGAYLLRWADTCIVSVPAQHVEGISAAVSHRSPDELFDIGALATLFAGEVERIIGPATQAWIDEHDFRPTDERETHPLTTHDTVALRHLAAACDPSEWEHSGIASEDAIVFGCYSGEQLAAAGMLRAAGTLRQIGIVTHPAFRGQGYGRAVVSAMTATALREGTSPHYQTLAANVASRAIARALGFTEYARTLAVRLRER